jgi:hypothetical protein
LVPIYSGWDVIATSPGDSGIGKSDAKKKAVLRLFLSQPCWSRGDVLLLLLVVRRMVACASFEGSNQTMVVNEAD